MYSVDVLRNRTSSTKWEINPKCFLFRGLLQVHIQHGCFLGCKIGLILEETFWVTSSGCRALRDSCTFLSPFCAVRLLNNSHNCLLSKPCAFINEQLFPIAFRHILIPRRFGIPLITRWIKGTSVSFFSFGGIRDGYRVDGVRLEFVGNVEVVRFECKSEPCLFYRARPTYIGGLDGLYTAVDSGIRKLSWCFLSFVARIVHTGSWCARWICPQPLLWGRFWT